MAPMKVLVVIPSYEERANLKVLLPRLLALKIGLQVLVVDDASPDGTALAVRTLARRHPGRVHLLQRPSKQGLGSAYVQGFTWGLERGFSRLVQMDADLSHDPADVPRLLARLDHADLAVGTRYHQGRTSVVNWPLRRLALSRFANRYARLVTGLPLSDATGGFKAWRAEALRALDLGSVRSDGYSFQIEMNFKAWKKGCSLAEVPIVFTDRAEGRSKMSGAIVREAVWRVWALRLGFN